ncbi:sigma-54-dependent Fis family transcriptional regulator [Paradesulfitobacterium aromaticivorans]
MDEQWLELRRQWKQAVTTGTLANDLPLMIKESWIRCRERNVNPFLKTNPYLASAQELRERRERQEELLAITNQVMEKLAYLVKGSDFMVVFADKDGYILEAQGDASAFEFGKLSNFTVEACWAEELLGTNGVGTPLVTGQPVQIIGPQHWSLSAHNATCSGAPIRDDLGRVIGCLNMTGDYRKAHPHTLGMVVAAANAIENQFRLQQESNFKEAIMESLSEGVVVLNEAEKVTHMNQAAAKLLGLDGVDWNLITLEKLKKMIPGFERIMYLIQRYEPVNDELIQFKVNQTWVKCTLTIRTLRALKGGQRGIVLAFSETGRVNRLVKQIGGAKAQLTFKDIVGSHPSITKVINTARKVALSSSHILLTGESGTGKEVFAQAIHNESYRARFPFVALNCAAIPRELIGSELFGYVEGAFTGARRGGNPGKFELADGGTLFLDEIGEMPLELQAHLLRVIEEKKITRLGGQEVIPVDVRIITATNRNLKDEAEKGNFRVDLFYRLNVINLSLPPLRERKSDIAILALYFAGRLGKSLGKAEVSIDQPALEALKSYAWPGNVRELQNTIERALNLLTGTIIKLEHLPAGMAGTGRNEPPVAGTSIKEAEINAIIHTLQKHGGNRKRAAMELGIARSTLYRKLEEFRLL